MDDRNGGGDGRRGGGPPQGGGRRRRRRRRHSRGPGEAPGPSDHSPNYENRELRRPPSSSGIDPFELFCAACLGITPQNTYRAPSVIQVARRFNTTPEALKALMERYGLDYPTLAQARFDVQLAQLDMQVIPDGIDRTEQAKVIWTDFLADSPRTRERLEEVRRQMTEASRQEEPVQDDDGGDDEEEDSEENEEVQEALPPPPPVVEEAPPRRPRAPRRRSGGDGEAAGA